MRTILVDDEEGARGQLRSLLAAHPDLSVVGEADHPLDAIRMINSLAPELVFLDIQMPLMDGFDLLPYLSARPLVIFCTAYDSYALKAFEVNALDYLLKPVSPERLALALRRATNEWSKLASLATMAPRPQGLRNIVCHQGSEHRVLWLRDIVAFHKDGRYTAVHNRDGSCLLTDLTLDYLEKKIVHPDFFRLNRGAILRRDQVASFRTLPHGSGLVTTTDGEEVTIRRARYQPFKNWLETETPDE